MIRADLRTYLLSQSDITDLVGTRIYWVRIPQKNPSDANYPCITYRRATGGHVHNLDGAQGYAEAIVEIDIWGPDSEVVENVGEQVRESLQGFRGEMGTTDVRRRVTLEDEQDFYYPSEVGDDVGVYRIQYKYKIGYGESVPCFS